MVLLAVFAQAPLRNSSAGKNEGPGSPSGSGRTRRQSGASGKSGDTKADHKSTPWDAICTVARRIDPRQEFQGPDCLAVFSHAHQKTAIAIAAIPHPFRTHLDMSFDRQLDTLNGAASENKFLFDEYWLPWPRSPGNSAAKVDPATPEELKDEPGLLIYRSALATDGAPTSGPDFLFIFLVPETPTSGLDLDVFKKTLSYVRTLHCSSRESECGSTPDSVPAVIRMIGPNFSGSLDSLEKIASGLPRGKCLDAMSGTVTAASEVFLREHAAPTSPSQCAGQLAFRSVQTSDEKVFDLFKAHLQGSFRYSLDQIAILSEGDTAYGTQKVSGATNGKEPLRISFPRDIWRVRNASPAAKSDSSSSKNQPTAPEPLVAPLDLTDPVEHDDDSLPIYAARTPLTEEAILLDIALRLKESNVKVALILATNPLDSLYLLRFLHRACPDIRLVTRDADMLYSRPDAVSLNGVLSLSTFNLTHSTREGRVPIFPDTSEIGIFKATNLQIGALRRQHGGIRDVTSSPITLDAIGNGEFWPIAAISAQDPQPDLLRIEEDHRLIRAILLLLAVLGLTHALAITWTPRSTFFQDECDFRGDPSLALRKAICHQAALAALIGIQVTIGSVFLWADVGSRQSRLLLGSLAVLTSAYFYLLVWHIFIPAISRFRSDDRLIAISSRFYAVISALLFAVHAWYLGSWYRLVSSDNYNVAAFHLRSLNPISGLSPTLPLCAFLIVFYLAALSFVKRITYVEYRFPKMPVQELDPVMPTHFVACYKALKGIFSWILMSGQWFLAFLGVFVVSVAFLSPDKYVESVESVRYDNLVLALLISAIFVILLTWLRFLSAWSSLRRVLGQLEHLPLRLAFSRMPQSSVFSFWQASSANSSFLMLAESLETIRAIQSKSSDLIKADELKSFTEALRAFYSNAKVIQQRAFAAAASPISMVFRAAGRSSSATSDTDTTSTDSDARSSSDKAKEPTRLDKLQAAENALLAIVGSLLKPDGKLMQYWGTSQCAQVDRSSRTKEKSAEDQAPKPGDDVLQLAENLVAMRFYTLIRYVLTEMRNLLVLVITIYTVSIFALKCYPFRAHSAINWTLISVFILIGGLTMKAFAEMDRDAILSPHRGLHAGQDQSGVLHKSTDVWCRSTSVDSDGTVPICEQPVVFVGAADIGSLEVRSRGELIWA